MQIRRDKQNIIFDTREHICINFPTFSAAQKPEKQKFRNFYTSCCWKNANRELREAAFLHAIYNALGVWKVGIMNIQHIFCNLSVI